MSLLIRSSISSWPMNCSFNNLLPHSVSILPQHIHNKYMKVTSVYSVLHWDWHQRHANYTIKNKGSQCVFKLKTIIFFIEVITEYACEYADIQFIIYIMGAKHFFMVGQMQFSSKWWARVSKSPEQNGVRGLAEGSVSPSTENFC